MVNSGVLNWVLESVLRAEEMMSSRGSMRNQEFILRSRRDDERDTQ